MRIYTGNEIAEKYNYPAFEFVDVIEYSNVRAALTRVMKGGERVLDSGTAAQCREAMQACVEIARLALDPVRAYEEGQKVKQT